MIFGASACLVDDENRVLLIAREKEPFSQALAFPGGSVEPGETALQAARRELTEETGYVANGDPVASVVIENGSGDETFRVESFAFTEWIAPKTAGPLICRWMTIERAVMSTLAPGMSEALATFQATIANRPKK
jgi:ADP-ribose pyrophosphatase YjhB (NUDIX family)